MALPGFRSNKKFKRLVTLLRMPEAHVLGHVQMLWETCYEQASGALGDAVDVELASGWQGEPGALCTALMACGGGGMGLVEMDANGVYSVHDFWHHAPRYVADRAKKNAEREAQGETISSLRAKAGELGAAKRWQKDGNPMAICHPVATEKWQVNGNLLSPNGKLPSGGMANCYQSRPVQYSTKSTPPIVPLNGTKRPKVKKADAARDITVDYPPEVLSVVDHAKERWRRKQPDDSPINADWSMTRGRVDMILQAPGVKMDKVQMAEVLKKAIDLYLAKPKKAYRAPQFFFGPGTKEDPEPWRPFARDAYHMISESGKNEPTR